MSLCVVAQFPGSTPKDWEDWMKDVAPGGLPKGVATQVVGTSADGLTVITAWDDDEGEQFFQQHVVPVFQEHGLSPKVSKLDIYKHYRRP